MQQEKTDPASLKEDEVIFETSIMYLQETKSGSRFFSLFSE